MNETGMAYFQSERYMVSPRSNNTTGSSLIIVHWQRSFLVICACYKLLTGTAYLTLPTIMQLRAMYILMVTPLTLDIVQ